MNINQYSMVVNWTWVEGSIKEIPKVSSLDGCVASETARTREEG